jgi:hypothetical protein
MSEPDERDDELDGLRIRQLSALRRSAYRSRSHAFIAMCVCAVAVVQASVLLVQYLREFGFGWRPLVYLGFIVAGAFGVTFFLRRTTSLHKLAKQSMIAPPTTPPDFSTLSDGTQRWKNLEEIQ